MCHCECLRCIGELLLIEVVLVHLLLSREECHMNSFASSNTQLRMPMPHGRAPLTPYTFDKETPRFRPGSETLKLLQEKSRKNPRQIGKTFRNPGSRINIKHFLISVLECKQLRMPRPHRRDPLTRTRSSCPHGRCKQRRIGRTSLRMPMPRWRAPDS